MPKVLYKFVVDSNRHMREPTHFDKIMFETVIERKVSPTVLKYLRSRPMVVHGARSLNIQVSPHLRKATRDWDIVAAQNAMRKAVGIEGELDRAFRSNMFFVVVMGIEIKGKPIDVYRVISRADRKPIVDVTEDVDLPDYTVINDVRFETLKALRKRTVKILKNPKFKYRWRKEREKLWRIDSALKGREWQRSTSEWMRKLLR